MLARVYSCAVIGLEGGVEVEVDTTQGFPGMTIVGLTDAAGAVVTGETYRRAGGLGLRLGDHLNRNDSYSFFAALDNLLKPGPTGTNVGDLTILFSF